MLEWFFEEFMETLRQLGIGRGDILYVSSDLKKLFYLLASEHDILLSEERSRILHGMVRCIQQMVGEEGTILFPVFSWSFCRGDGFDYRRTKGEVGAFSNWVMQNRKDFVRTRHPMYSFMVWGKDAGYLKTLDNQDAWGVSSPFQYLYENKAKQMMFNIEAYKGLTFGHYVEQFIKVPYRHPKYFFGTYVDEKGNEEIRMYSMYVRQSGVEVSSSVRNEFLIQHGAARQKEWKGNKITSVDISLCFPLLKDDMVNNYGRNTLAFGDYKMDWGKINTTYEIGRIPVCDKNDL